jgi:putative ABC transport system permease protein
VRKVLGASASSIYVLLSREFLKWVALANVIAWPLAYFAMSTWLRNFAFRVGIGWGIFVVSAAAALAIAALTVGFQTLRAARSNPVDSLRYE